MAMYLAGWFLPEALRAECLFWLLGVRFLFLVLWPLHLPNQQLSIFQICVTTLPSLSECCSTFITSQMVESIQTAIHQ